MAAAQDRTRKSLARAQSLLAAGATANAVAELEHTLKRAPHSYAAWFLLGQILGANGDHPGASRCFAQATRLEPKQVDAWFNRGVALAARALQSDALACFAHAARLAGGRHRQAQLGAAACRMALDQPAEAALLYAEWLALAPADAEAHLLAGICAQARGDSAAARVAYRAARALGLNNYTLQLNLGTCHQALGEPDEAVGAAREALRLQPGDAVAQYNLGVALLEAGEVGAAIAALDACPLPRAAVARLNALNYLAPPDPQALLDAHRAWGERQVSALGEVGAVPSGARAAGSRIRLGFVSPDFRQHPVAFFIEPLLAQLDRSRFEIFLYFDAAIEDAVTARIRALAEHWCPIATLGDHAVAERIVADRVDLLFDLAGHTSMRCALFARRMAPVQASYLGYAASSGLSSMDFFLTDSVLDPPGVGEPPYVEQLCRLGRCFATYAPPPDAPPSRQRVPSGAPLLASFARLNKISEPTLADWAAVLGAVPAARLLLLAKGLGSSAGQDALRRRLVEAGIDPARVELRPAVGFDEYLALHGEVDLLLDTRPWSAHTTALHGLWMGVPTVTTTGPNHVGRFCSMLMRGVGLERFVVPKSVTLAHTVAEVLSDRELMLQVRSEGRVQLAASLLCDHDGLARRFETACERMLAQRLSGVRGAIDID